MAQAGDEAREHGFDDALRKAHVRDDSDSGGDEGFDALAGRLSERTRPLLVEQRKLQKG